MPAGAPAAASDAHDGSADVSVAFADPDDVSASVVYYVSSTDDTAAHAADSDDHDVCGSS